MAVLEREPILTARTYEPNFDRRDYSKNGIENKDQLDRYTTRQVETLLGERLNVLLSKNRYEIKNNVVYGENMNEPFLNVMKRGRDYRRKIGGDQRIDSKREQAEIDGFSMMQSILCNPNTLVNTMMISISPPGDEGSLYRHNFYDVFTLKKEEGERFIEARRYSSALTKNEYREKLESFYPKIYGKDVSLADDYFLSHPVIVSNGSLSNPDSVHAYFHKNHEYMEERDFEQVLKVCSPFRKRYIRALSENPRDVDTHSLILDAILNKADEEADNIRHSGDSERSVEDSRIPNGDKRFWTSQNDIFVRTYDSLSLDREIEFLGNQPVRQVATGCGSSSGFSKNNSGARSNGSVFSGAFSIADFGTSQEWFTCPKCGYAADGPIGNKCPGCNLTKEDYAEESGEPVCD